MDKIEMVFSNTWKQDDELLWLQQQPERMQMKKPSAKTLLTSLDVAYKIGLILSLLCIAYSQIMIASEVSKTNKILSFNGMYSTDPALDISISHLLAGMADGSANIANELKEIRSAIQYNGK